MLRSTQSGFKSGCSCDPALLNITHDIVKATEEGGITILALLNYTMAFDTISPSVVAAKLLYPGSNSNPIDVKPACRRIQC